ncbi:hypothetical protein SAMN05428949_1805 [Chitinophaga sp. YR627]|uniref:hypothetical protein n=1 Tax=Chitinophaga sp. YR627 TaxID=1881041 RepID=UPI0008EB6D55|nr:hypothetical protein [Chitinophaga sp. YR627]SFN18215.1 hypothetical protein SAMN05428949_1805 [Chitinophaga sp. YR627]
MATFIKSSTEQTSGRIVNLDLVTHINAGNGETGDYQIRFYFSKEHYEIWSYEDLATRDRDYDSVLSNEVKTLSSTLDI